MSENKNNKSQIEIKSDRALSEDNRKSILSLIAEKEYEIKETIDPEILGGFVVDVDSTRYDYSVKNRLKRIFNNLDSEIKKKAMHDISRSKDLEQTIARNREDVKKILDDSNLAEILKDIPAGEIKEFGEVVSIADGVCYAEGLPSCKNQELIIFDNDSYGLAMNLESDKVGIILLSNDSSISAGSYCFSTGKILTVPVGTELIGRVVDALGREIDGLGPIDSQNRRPIEHEAAPIIDRQEVNQPLYTGITAIDAMTPIGRGQRELIIGDRRSGKTSIAVDAIIRQKDQDVICIYVAIGQRMGAVAEVVKRLKDQDAMSYTTVVVASASDSPAMQYIAPYSACAMAEEFMYKQHKDVLIVYDDLSKHAVAYRSLSLLLRRPPGREAFPGDIFYIHSRLLERSARLSESLGSGSITALPIIETLNGNISAYVPTNVISITDGQIFLDTDRFFSGIRPAINEGLSVSRVGGAAQTKAMKKVASSLRLKLSQAAELESFSKLNSDSDSSTKQLVQRGRLLRRLLCQGLGEIRRMNESVCLIYLCNLGKFDFLDETEAAAFFLEFLNFWRINATECIDRIETSGQITEADTQNMEEVFEKFISTQNIEA